MVKIGLIIWVVAIPLANSCHRLCAIQPQSYDDAVEIGRNTAVRKYPRRLGEDFVVAIATRDVRQHEFPDIAPGRKRGRLSRREMSIVARGRRVPVQKCRLDHEQVGVADMTVETVGGFRVADDDQLPAPDRRSEDVVGIDRPTVCEPDRPSLRQLFANGAIRHGQGREAIGLKMTADRAFEGEGEAVGVAMSDRKAADREVAGVEYLASNQRNKFERNGRASLAPQTREHPDDDFKGARAGMDRHRVIALSQPQSREETGNAEHVIEMTVGQEDPVEPSETGATPEQLALCPLPAIDQDAIVTRFHQNAWMIALRRWDAGRGSEKGQIEHELGDSDNFELLTARCHHIPCTFAHQ